MSEYWKSIPKYYCKHCKLYVSDTPLSKKTHEATPKHQGNLKRFLRDLHRANERDQNASENAKREVARLNTLTSDSPSSSSSASASFSVAKPVSKTERWGSGGSRGVTEAERKQQLKELEDLGVALPEEYRSEMAMMGDWTSTGVEEAGKKPLTEKEKVALEFLQGQKRKFEEEEKERRWKEMDEDEKAIRTFRIQTMTYPGMEKEEADVDVGELFGRKGKAKVKEVIPEIEKDPEVKEEIDVEKSGAAVETIVKKEVPESPPGIKTEPEPEPSGIKKEAEAPGEGIVFKKRKVKNIRKK